MARRRVNTTRHEIIQTATKLFLQTGYSNTTPRQICQELDISTGNLTYYFPTKEHLLAVLVEIHCGYQGKMMQDLTRDDRNSPLLAVCLELATMASMCQSNRIARDVFQSAYCSTMCLEIIRKYDSQRAKRVFREFCPDWGEQEYAEAEILVSGIEYATLTATDDEVPLDLRIEGALNNILRIYNVPEQLRRIKIEKILAMDYQSLGASVLDQFRKFVELTNEQAFERLLSGSVK